MPRARNVILTVARAILRDQGVTKEDRVLRI